MIFPGGTSGKEPACQCRRLMRGGFDLWVGKIPWRRKWQPTPVFLPREFHGPRSLAGSWAAHGPTKNQTRLKWLSTAYFQLNDRLTSGYKSNIRGFPGDSVVRNPPAMQEMAVRSPGRSPGGENGNWFQSSCLGNPMNREAWWVTVHGVAKQLEMIEDTHTHNTNIIQGRSVLHQ